jgi:Amt family ammonium transporter
MPHLDTGNTGFMILCTSLVMLMTPGLAFFYGWWDAKTSWPS